MAAPDRQSTVAVDVAPLLGTRTGVGTAVAELLTSLLAVADRAGLSLVAYGLTGRGASGLGAVVPAGMAVRDRPMPAAVLLRLWRHWERPAAELWTGAVSVVHGTNFVVPPTRSAGRLATVHDLAPLLHPEWCTPVARRYPDLIRRALERGAHVHTGSETVGREVVEHLGADPSRVHVVLNGVPRAVAPAASSGYRPAGRPYVLGLGTVEPRKNFPGLVAAFDLIAGEFPDLDLVIAGPPGWGTASLEAAVAASPYRDRIRRPGWVTDAGPLVAGATVFAYPSLYEGFGFPALEAMAAGVPVVAGRAGSLPEILGEAALLVDPGDEAALATALGRAVGDAAERDRLVAAGAARVALYDWDRAAAQLLDVYRSISSSNTSR